jgi:hypothetical protein
MLAATQTSSNSPEELPQPPLELASLEPLPLEPLPLESAALPSATTPAAALVQATAAATLREAPSARIDREFISKHQLVERYIGGRLPPRGAQDLERFCRENPQLLEEINLAKNIQAAVQLLDSSGHASLWEPPVKPWWERPQVPIGAAVLAVLLGCLAIVSHSHMSDAQHALTALRQQATVQPLEASTSTRPITVIPSRTGPTKSLVTIGGGGSVQMADLKFDVSWTPLNVFRVTIDRLGQGRVGMLHNLARDSNGKLHIELNSSALGPGDYQFTIEGLNWKGEPIPQAWATISIAH